MSITREQISETVRKFGDELQAARNHQDDDLTPEGLASRREAIANGVRTRWSHTVRHHRAALADDARVDAFDNHKIRLDWNDAGAVAKAQSRWQAVEKKLDSGISIPEIVQNADESTLAAIREFYTDWAEIHQSADHGPYGRTTPDTTGVFSAVDERTAEVKGQQDALQRARDARGLHAAAEITLDHLQAVCDGRRDNPIDLATALAADAAANQAGAAAI